MDRRAFFRTARGIAPRTRTLSCEQLYMRYLDGKLRGTADRLFARLERDLAGAARIRLLQSAWLDRDDDFRRALQAVLAQFETRGGVVERV